MNALRFLGVCGGSFLALLFYAAYRCDQTLSNRLLEAVCTERYAQAQAVLRHSFPLPLWLRGCLPSAIWCFVGGCLCGGWRARLGSRGYVGLWGLFPLLNAFWEGVQALGWTDGHADAADVCAGVVGGLLARALFLPYKGREHALLVLWDWRWGFLLLYFSAMGLADVWR